MITFTFFTQGKSTAATAPAGSSLAQAVYTSGQADAPALCSGIGRCGQCRMRLDHAPSPSGDDLAYFSDTEIAEGWRLGCRHVVQEGMQVHLPDITPVRRRSPAGKADGQMMLAVDLGTTSLHWAAVGQEQDSVRIVTEGSETNPQMGAGSEVMSRLASAREPAMRARLAMLVKKRIASIIEELEVETGQQIASCAIAGNAAMTNILLDLPVEGLSRAPYSLNYHGDDVVELDIASAGTSRATGSPKHNTLPPAYIPPQPAPFVGGDISAGMAHLCCTETAPEFPFILADLGTNGEFVLALSPQKSLITSVAMGPALEGIGLTHGSMAQEGAATAFAVTPIGLTPAVLNAEGNAVAAAPASMRPADVKAGSLQNAGAMRSISGTGYLSLIHALLRTGVLTREGQFNLTSTSPIGQRLARNIIQPENSADRDGPKLVLAQGVTLSAHDVEEILKVKAAFSLAFERLLCEASLSPSDVSHIFLAGTLGQHVAVADLEALGFIPAELGPRTKAVGNSSLQGAIRLLTRPECRQWAADWSASTTSVDLTAAPDFTINYMRHMRFS
ncbi:ASKHA domain-containing protein [Oleidesulfovibrio sp.]|uniref:ASKHA domain-containing protein n=1 Tax=Oleidesulfovibrio sp. TaxID=2909707 RepID=UPI003A843F88